MKANRARARSKFWEDSDLQQDERLCLDSVCHRQDGAINASQRSRQTMMKREEERQQRQKAKQEKEKERVREVIMKDQAKEVLKRLKAFLEENESSLDTVSNEDAKAMKLAAALPFRDFVDFRDIVNALHRSNLNLQSQQTIFKFVKEYIASQSLMHYMENVNENFNEIDLEPWHEDGNEYLCIYEFCHVPAIDPVISITPSQGHTKL